MQKNGSGQYAVVNGLRIYYEIHGTGEPLVLLHGGLGGVNMFGPNLGRLSRNRRVIAVELQAHGRTADIDRPLSFESMADDIAGLIKHLSLEQADVMGFSLGGGVALQTATRHRGVVRKLIVVSAPFRRDGWYPEVLASMERIGPAMVEQLKQSHLYKMYPDVNWPTLLTKMGALLRNDYDWSKDITAIQKPVMLVFADADSLRPEHVVEFFGLLGGGLRDAGLDGTSRPVSQLAVLPGLTHYTIATSPMLAAVAEAFLDS